MSIKGALLTRTTDLTAQNYTAGAIPTFNSTVYDPDVTVSASHFTIPAAYNGLYGILTYSMSIQLGTAGDTYQSWIALNSGGTPLTGVTWKGVSIMGEKINGNGQSSTSAWLQQSTGPVLLNTGDRYEPTFQTFTDTSVTFKAESSFGLAVMQSTSTPATTVAKLSANIAAHDYSTPAVIGWDGADVMDAKGVHDPVTSNSQFIIPASLNSAYVVVGAAIYATNVTSGSGFSVSIRKNSSLTYAGFGGNSPQTGPTLGTAAACCRTQAIQVTTGDVFETLVYCNDTSIDINSTRSNMYLYQVA